MSLPVAGVVGCVPFVVRRAMARLRLIGCFKEIFPAEPDAESMIPLLGSTPQADEQRIVEYLRSGRPGAACGWPLKDAFDAAKWIGPITMMDDGEWTWPSVLAYYVETYHCRLPDEFVCHMHARDWHP